MLVVKFILQCHEYFDNYFSPCCTNDIMTVCVLRNFLLIFLVCLLSPENIIVHKFPVEFIKLGNNNESCMNLVIVLYCNLTNIMGLVA